MTTAVGIVGLLLLWAAPFFAVVNAVALVRCVRALRAGGPLAGGLPFVGAAAAGAGLLAATGGFMSWPMIYWAVASAVADALPSFGIVLCHARDQPPARLDPPPASRGAGREEPDGVTGGRLP